MASSFPSLPARHFVFRGGRDQKGSGWRRGLALVGLTAALATGAPARAAEIVLEPSAVLKLLMQSLFKREGKYDLRGGACYAYLEQPSVSLREGRVHIRSRLVSKTGVPVQGGCMGVNLVSWTVVSAAPVPQEGRVCLQDIRVDDVEDKTVRLVLESGLVPSLPGAVELDVRQAVANMLKDPRNPMQGQVEAFNFETVKAEDERLLLRFDFRMVAR